MSRRTVAASSVVAAVAATAGVAIALSIHSGSAGVAAATTAPAPPLHATVGGFHFSGNGFTIDSDRRSEVVMPKITIHAGASSGWHVHTGPGFVVVTSGTLTLYQVTDNRCVKSTYGPGQGFFEAPGVVHIARNEGTSGDVTDVATFLGVAPGTTAYKSIVPAPAACPGIN